ncbi:MAG: class I SAM-dependent methyltransferase [Rhodospirillaceae bacterium]|nr:class I SAM-dependent methyltransferase [Rhodospirillaceae bacterium]
MTLACANCQSPRLLSYMPYKYHGVEFFDLFPKLEILGCADCSLVQVDHTQLDAAKLQAFYENEYRRDDTPASAYAGQLKTERFEARAESLLQGALPLIGAKSVTTIFELGAGYGYNIRRFGQHFKNAVLYADDPDSNHNLFAEVKRAKLTGLKPDIVILSHVLEHVIMPRARISEIVSRLTPGGVIVVEVPNEKHALLAAKGSHQPHITFFTRETLRKVFENHANLSIDRVVSAGFLNSDNDKPYITTTIHVGGWKPVTVSVDRRTLDRAGFDFTNERDDEEGGWLRLYARKT